MSREKQIEEMACEKCLHHFACLTNSEYVPTPCPAYEDKAGYRKQSDKYLVKENGDIEPLNQQSEGEWVWIADDSPMCNICGNVFDTNDNADAGTGLWKYCPNCGARMKGGAG